MFSFKHSLLFTAMVVTGAYAQSRPLAVTGARIEIGDGRVIPNGTIVVRDGKIVAVGESVTIPAGADVLDAKGGVLYPGFIDAYTTEGLKLPSAPSGGTPPRITDAAPATMWHGNPKGLRTDIVAAKCLDVKDRIKDNYAQGITTALLTSGTGTVRGIASLVDYLGEGNVLLPNAAAEFSFRSSGGGGAGGGSGSGSGYPGTLFGIVASLRQALADAQYYASQKEPKKDAGWENMRPLAAGKIPAIFVASTNREVARAARIADEFGLRLILQGASEGFKDSELLLRAKASVILSPDLGFEPEVKEGSGPSATPIQVQQERYDLWKSRTQNARILSEAGIPLALSSNGASLGDFLKNVRKLIGAGFARDAALKALTSGAASMLGIGDRIGTLEAGKVANLVLFSGDFADEKSQVLATIVEGNRTDVKGAGK